MSEAAVIPFHRREDAARAAGPAVPGPAAGSAAAPAVDPAVLRAAFHHHAAGVAVITLTGPVGPVGFTASSVASVSAQPPMLSWNIALTSSSLPALLETDTAVVHFLAENHLHIGRRFSGPAAQRFDSGLDWTYAPTGEPILAESAVRLRVELKDRLTVGDHLLLTALIVEASLTDASPRPLIYHATRYHRGVALG